jgi:hypothetical protein
MFWATGRDFERLPGVSIFPKLHVYCILLKNYLFSYLVVGSGFIFMLGTEIIPVFWFYPRASHCSFYRILNEYTITMAWILPLPLHNDSVAKL